MSNGSVSGRSRTTSTYSTIIGPTNQVSDTESSRKTIVSGPLVVVQGDGPLGLGLDLADRY